MPVDREDKMNEITEADLQWMEAQVGAERLPAAAKEIRRLQASYERALDLAQRSQDRADVAHTRVEALEGALRDIRAVTARFGDSGSPLEDLRLIHRRADAALSSSEAPAPCVSAPYVFYTGKTAGGPRTIMVSGKQPPAEEFPQFNEAPVPPAPDPSADPTLRKDLAAFLEPRTDWSVDTDSPVALLRRAHAALSAPVEVPSFEELFPEFWIHTSETSSTSGLPPYIMSRVREFIAGRRS
jgi:hypothetical protein